jgi:hypothetical protein
VKTGEAVYERDSVLFDEIQYSFPVIAALLRVASANKGKLNVLDFGGSEKSHYKKLYVYNRILTSQLKENEETFYLTKSPYCSSLL